MEALRNQPLRHEDYWTVAPGQLADDEVVNFGFDNIEDAQRAASSLDVGTVEVRQLDTLEHPLSTDDPSYDAKDIINSKRFCLVQSRVTT